jgi:hypothetical protein
VKKREWSDEDRAKIIEMFNNGSSSGSIASEFGATRNAIIGIIHRARKKDPTKVRRDFERPIKPKEEKPKREAPKLKLSKPPLLTPTSAEIEAMEARIRLRVIDSETAVTMAELEPHHCKFPHGDPKLSDFRFCGKRRVDNKRPYCQEHTIACGRLYDQLKAG